MVRSGVKLLGMRLFLFFFQAEDGIRDAQESRGLGDVYKRQIQDINAVRGPIEADWFAMQATVEKLAADLTAIDLSLIHI